MHHKYLIWMSHESAELGQDKIRVVPSQLVEALFTRVVHAVAAAVVAIADEPAILLEFEVAFVSIFTEFTGGVTLVTHVKGVGNHNPGTAGICTGT